jgi:hypothetical protein
MSFRKVGIVTSLTYAIPKWKGEKGYVATRCYIVTNLWSEMTLNYWVIVERYPFPNEWLAVRFLL